MKTRAQRAAESYPPETPQELQRLKALFVKPPAIRKLRRPKAKALKRRNQKVDDYDMEMIRIMRLEHKHTYERIGQKLSLTPMTVFLALWRFKSRQN